MEIFSSFLRLMDGWSRLTKKLERFSKRINVLTGLTPRQSLPMYAIILIEQLKLDPQGHLEVIALLESEERKQRGTFLFTAPEVAPIRAKTTIPQEALPPGKSFQGKSTAQWTTMINQHQLFTGQQWKVVDEIEEPKEEDGPYKGGRLFF